ncbi:hypothetical protein OH492_15715 [Vibrio chagasii]|nr:hypothetical protein [Vibrio chagasii]
MATKLASRGYIVAAADHPVPLPFDQSPEQAAKWWKDPRCIAKGLFVIRNLWKQSANVDTHTADRAFIGWLDRMQIGGSENG